MANLREILKKKILQELYNDTESTHYDIVNKQKIKIFENTIDFESNTAKAEITSGKNKGLINLVNLDDIVELNLSKMIAEEESGYYPTGAEFDSDAPWNETNNAEISKFELDDNNQKFHVQLTNGKNFDVDYIDILELYWKNHPGTFEEHTREFEDLDDKMDSTVIRKLYDEKFDFSEYLNQEIENSKSIPNEDEDEFDIEFEDDY